MYQIILVNDISGTGCMVTGFKSISFVVSKSVLHQRYSSDGFFFSFLDDTGIIGRGFSSFPGIKDSSKSESLPTHQNCYHQSI